MNSIQSVQFACFILLFLVLLGKKNLLSKNHKNTTNNIWKTMGTFKYDLVRLTGDVMLIFRFNGFWVTNAQKTHPFSHSVQCSSAAFPPVWNRASVSLRRPLPNTKYPLIGQLTHAWATSTAYNNRAAVLNIKNKVVKKVKNNPKYLNTRFIKWSFNNINRSSNLPYLTCPFSNIFYYMTVEIFTFMNVHKWVWTKEYLQN